MDDLTDNMLYVHNLFSVASQSTNVTSQTTVAVSATSNANVTPTTPNSMQGNVCSCEQAVVASTLHTVHIRMINNSSEPGTRQYEVYGWLLF
jgi:hypothetical protein